MHCTANEIPEKEWGLGNEWGLGSHPNPAP